VTVNPDAAAAAENPPHEWPLVAVVGGGAVGAFFGGMLARAGAPVTLVGRSRHVDARRRDGLFIDSLTFQDRVAVDASTDVSAAANVQLVLFSVKSPDTAETARELAGHIALL